jgi:internalin A
MTETERLSMEVPCRARRVFGLGLLVLASACAGGPTRGETVSPSVAGPPVLIGPVCLEPSTDAAVSFPDVNLDRVVRTALGVDPDAVLTCALLARITRLHAPDARIASLAGIENLVGLHELHVYGSNSIRDVTPLSYLPALSDLNLARNEIEDIGPLASVRTLTSLDLYGNPIRDISPVGRLTGLIRLRIGHAAGVSDLEPLRGLTLLARLQLGANQIVDVRPLAALPQLTRLSLADNPHLSDIGPLSALVNLQTLELGGTAVSDISPVGALARLTSLGLGGTRVHDVSPLIGLAGLARLDLRGNMQLSDIRPLLFHPGLGAGDAIRVEGTGVSCTDIAALEAKGVTVFKTCP